MTIYTADREPIHLAGRLTSTGFQFVFIDAHQNQEAYRKPNLSDGARLFLMSFNTRHFVTNNHTLVRIIWSSECHIGNMQANYYRYEDVLC
ncbi:hypothetical protein CGH48_16195 [Vibrio parahaemolyticus]|nr:hypothetical protein CGH48_16195 [Vibrio parahaemolyticus]